MTSNQTEIAGTSGPSSTELHSSTYNVFVLVLTVFSLVIMLLLLVPWLSPATKITLQFVDILICIIFFGDFLSHLHRTPNSRVYFFRQGGWLDLLGSIPSIPGLPRTALLRLARLSRLARIIRSLQAKDSKELWADFMGNRAQSAMLVTVFTLVFVITVSAVMVLQVETRSEGTNIVTGGDAFWWALVTVTTVGYGDQVPVSGLGRLIAVPLMIVGVGFFGVLTSYLSSAFIVPAPEIEEIKLQAARIEADIAHLQTELATIKEMIRDLNR